MSYTCRKSDKDCMAESVWPINTRTHWERKPTSAPGKNLGTLSCSFLANLLVSFGWRLISGKTLLVCSLTVAANGNPLAIFNLIDNSDSCSCSLPPSQADPLAVQFSCLISITMARREWQVTEAQGGRQSKMNRITLIRLSVAYQAAIKLKGSRQRDKCKVSMQTLVC